MTENTDLIYEVKKTNQLTDLEIVQLNDLYFETFLKKRNKNEFNKKFLSNQIGFSFHGLIKKENIIVGSYHILPIEYYFFNKKNIFGLSVDTMLNKKFKFDLLCLRKISFLVYDELIKYDIFFVYGFPNKNFHTVQNRLLEWKDIGLLNYYILPLKTFNIFFLRHT